MLEQIDQQAQRLMWEVRQQTLQLMTKKFNVAEKTSARDLVTTVDKQNEKMIDERLKTIDPACRIVSEEGFGDQVDDLKGHVWIVDPIDGTMNFVMQKRNFAIMMGLYVDGQPTLGYSWMLSRERSIMAAKAWEYLPTSSGCIHPKTNHWLIV